MSLYNFIDYNILLPIGDLIYGSKVKKKLIELRKLEKLSSDELVEYQNEKLRQLIQHCYATVPYYKHLFDNNGITPEDIKTREDLPKIPILTKQIIRENYKDLFSTAIPEKRRRLQSTGGSTGNPTKYYTDNNEWSCWKASTLRAWEWYGIHLGDKIFSLGGNSIAKVSNPFSLKNLYDTFIMRNRKFNSTNVTDDDMLSHYNALCKIKPKAIRGYGSSLYILARYIEKHNLTLPPIKAILTTGEVLLTEYRKKIEDVFQAPVFDAYGAGDGGILAHECPLHTGLHITEIYSLLEITDKNGNPIADGEIGNVCATDLENFVFPFIRYHVGDMSCFSTTPCECFRNSRQLSEVIGRVGKLIYNKHGVPISPTTLYIMLYKDLEEFKPENIALYNKIDKFQIHQDKQGDICVYLKLKKEFEKDFDEFNYIKDNFSKHFVDSKISLLSVNNISNMPSGKEDFCVSEYEYTI